MPIKDIQKQLRKNKILTVFASLRITVICLLILFVLVLWGTIAQVDQGLYLAQERFFYSWYFLAGGFLPFPGGQLVLWMLFINLLSALALRFVYTWKNIGLLITHIGLLTYFVAAYITFNVTMESNVTLYEGGYTNLAQDYYSWEVSIWSDEKDSFDRSIQALYVDKDIKNKTIKINNTPLTLKIQDYYANALAFRSRQSSEFLGYVNGSGIAEIAEQKINKEREKNFPGIVFSLEAEGKTSDVLLYGGEIKPTQVSLGDRTYYFILRQRQHELPFIIKLKDFRKEVYPNTETASKYESLVEIDVQGLQREVLIYMNHPFRYKDYTLYQASYSIDAMGRERSTLAVVKNSGRILPYASSLITFLGLSIHFMVSAVSHKRGKK